MSRHLGTFEHDRDETLDYTINWNPSLQDGDPIDGAVAWVPPDGLELGDTTPHAPFIVSGYSTVWVMAGSELPAQDYFVEGTVTTVAQRIIQGHFIVRLR